MRCYPPTPRGRPSTSTSIRRRRLRQGQPGRTDPSVRKLERDGIIERVGRNTNNALAAFGDFCIFVARTFSWLASSVFRAKTIRLLLPQMERDAVVRRLRETCTSLLGEERLRQAAQHNWYVLTGEALPA